jgi:hypothetical protein
MSDAPEQTPEQIKAAKRAEIMKRVEEAKKQQEKMYAKIEAQREAEFPSKVTPQTHYGSHLSITCDGCGVSPIRGYRYKCHNCENHDLCEDCFHAFKEEGKLRHENRVNVISKKVEDHDFFVFVEPKIFKPMVSGEKRASNKKTKPNELCPCGSGLKYKKCCANKAVPDPVLTGTEDRAFNLSSV